MIVTDKGMFLGNVTTYLDLAEHGEIIQIICTPDGKTLELKVVDESCNQ